jgi:toxin-antitoxin system PIN domain toxin
MILPDVNVLVYAFREGSEHHATYARWLNAVLSTEELLLPDLVVTGFLRVVTSTAATQPAASATSAFAFVDALRQVAWIRTPHGSRVVLDHLRTLCQSDPTVRGNLIPDAYLAATALAHDARLATRDRGFARYTGLRWFDPADGPDLRR